MTGTGGQRSLTHPCHIFKIFLNQFSVEEQWYIIILSHYFILYISMMIQYGAKICCQFRSTCSYMYTISPSLVNYISVYLRQFIIHTTLSSSTLFSGYPFIDIYYSYQRCPTIYQIERVNITPYSSMC